MINNCQEFASGHRSCRGCTAVPQPIRYTISAMKEEGIPVVIANATGCTEVTSTLTPYTCWNVPYMHSVFANVAATAAGIEAAYKALEKKGKMKKLNGGQDLKKPAIIALAGDGGTYDIGLQALSGAFERRHDFVYICYDNEAYMNCLSTDSLIMTAAGLKKITEIKSGEQVYAFDQKNHQLVLKKCTGVFDNGVKQVYKLQTLHHDIKATSNHPFLVLQRGGRGGRNEFVWKVLGKIKSGDEIVVLKNLGDKGLSGFNFKSVRVENYKVGDKSFKTEKVKSVKLIGREPTLDLRVEGEHNFIADGIVVHNTGNQRSSATPFGAATSTTPTGQKVSGKQFQRKDLTKIVIAHNIPYVATASVSHRADFTAKIKKAVAVEGPAFINILAPCTLGWKFPEDMGIEIARLGVETNFWPLYEVEEGKYKMSYQPQKRKSIEEFIKPQGRFKHLMKGDKKVITEIQKRVDDQWGELMALRKQQ